MPRGAEVNPLGCCSAEQPAAERPRKLAGPAKLGSRPQERWQRPTVPGSLRGRMKPLLQVWETAHGHQLVLQECTVLPGRSAAAAPSLGGTESRESTRPSPSSSVPSLERHGRWNLTRSHQSRSVVRRLVSQPLWEVWWERGENSRATRAQCPAVRPSRPRAVPVGPPAGPQRLVRARTPWL